MEYSDEFSRMQLEAMERLRQMQARSKSAVNEPPPEEPMPSPAPATEASVDAWQEHSQNLPRERQGTDLLSGIFGGTGLGSDKLLILLVLFMLYKNKADLKLLIALAYLLL